VTAYDPSVRRALPLILVALALAACGGQVAPKATTSTAAPTGHVRVVIVGQDHHPLVGKRWHYEVRVTVNGKPVTAFIHLQFLFGGSPVGEVGKHTVKNGVWQETFGTPGHPPFPAAAAGQQLVLAAFVKVKGYPPAKAGWPVVPQ
jgi:hypothetical protein